MLTTKPYLRVRRPSPTTAEFIVSTLPPLTLPLRILLLLTALARVLAALAAALLLHAKWLQSPYYSTNNSSTKPAATGPSAQPPTLSEAFVQQALALAHASPPGRLLAQLAASLPAWALLPLCLAVFLLAARHAHTTESLLVLRGLGIQTGSSAAIYGGGSTRFIPTAKIRDVLINEAFRGFEVRYYLVVVVDGEEDVVVVFPKLLPKREIVEKVWREVRMCLWEPGAVRIGSSEEKC